MMERLTWRRALATGAMVGALTLGGLIAGAGDSRAGLLIGTAGPDVLIGKDDDTNENPAYHPPGTAADQAWAGPTCYSAWTATTLSASAATICSTAARATTCWSAARRTEPAPNSDYMLGGDGDDVFIWAPGSGSELFLGGTGVDAIILAPIDRDGAAPAMKMVDLGRGERPIATANLTGSPGFCRIDPAPEGSGYEWLVRFVVRASGALAVTVRLAGVEQVFCASEAGGAAVWADLTSYDGGELRPITVERIRQINPLAGAIVR
ncbi:MAG: hypothetical protein U0531_01110 [Dehalococcoidia bacterium]